MYCELRKQTHAARILRLLHRQRHMLRMYKLTVTGEDTSPTKIMINGWGSPGYLPKPNPTFLHCVILAAVVQFRTSKSSQRQLSERKKR